MTKQVVYKDRAIDARVLNAEDLRKAGVEDFKKMTFRTNEPVEVSDEVAEALTGHALFKGFSIVEDADEAKAKADEPEADADAKADGTSQEAVSAPRPRGTNRASTP